MICDSIIRADCKASNQRYQRWMSFAPAWHLENKVFSNGGIYKTHAKWSELPKNVKIVFVYDDPFQIIGSLLKKLQNNEQRWLQVHGAHLTNRKISIEDMTIHDVFELEENFVSWTAHSNKNIFFSHYDDLWKNEKLLGKFLEIDLCLPTRESRPVYFPHTTNDSALPMQRAYGKLRTMTEQFRIHS